MASHNPEERRLIASIAANSRWANEDPAIQSERRRRSVDAHFEQQVDPDQVLDPAERARRAQRAKTAHFQRLALKSAQVRRARKVIPPSGGTATEAVA